MSFKNLGEAIDKALNAMSENFVEAAHELTQAVFAGKPITWPYGQGRSLAVDMANEGYTIIGYEDVRVIRDGDSGIVEYKESGSWEELLRYDLTELEDDDGV